MSLIEEIQEIQNESHEKWFDRWYEKYGLVNKIKKSAMQGYVGYRISVSAVGDEYSRIRRKNPKTIELLKKELGKGFEVCLKEEYEKNVFGYPTYKSYILISW
ncbi:hypothetical protein [Lactococcus petauri]|uniref:hypothetical protein n=1 Tax=Lactococcus petauri TaxID=1940789 RepID=UPI00254FBC8F|nr:hypothetical protein [Lactococcus petauri]